MTLNYQVDLKAIKWKIVVEAQTYVTFYF